jgi:DNA adenine methylase
VTSTPLKPPAPYYGGKTRLAPWIVSLMHAHQRYIEPFMGTASVLLAKPQSRFEVINDLDGDVVTFFRVLRDRPEDLERACRLTPYARDEFNLCRDRRTPVVDELEQARRWWVRVMQGFNNAPGDWCNGWSISARRGTPESRSAQNTVGRFEAIAERLVGVAIENQPALDVIAKFDDETAVIYCDPPYLGTTRSGRTRREQVKDYAHDMLEDDDHAVLAELLRACRGHVLLSGYESALYDKLYDGWWRVESTVVRVAANHMADTSKRHATEVVWSNRELDLEQLEFEMETA